MDASNGGPDHCARRGRPTNAKAMPLLLQSEDDAAARCTPPSPPKPANPPSRCMTGTRRGNPRQRAAVPAARRPRQSPRAASSGSSSRSPRIGCPRRVRAGHAARRWSTAAALPRPVTPAGGQQERQPRRGHHRCRTVVADRVRLGWTSPRRSERWPPGPCPATSSSGGPTTRAAGACSVSSPTVNLLS
jgi:hypothetical protein